MGFAPSEFWAGTQASFGAAVRGRIAARKDERNRALFTAWWTERLAREDALQGYRHYLDQLEEAKPEGPGDRLAHYRALQAEGVPVKITRISKKPD